MQQPIVPCWIAGAHGAPKHSRRLAVRQQSRQTKRYAGARSASWRAASKLSPHTACLALPYRTPARLDLARSACCHADTGQRTANPKEASSAGMIRHLALI